MKLKQKPEDFFVEEVTSVQPGPDGSHALYRLEKRGWSTPDALGLVRRRWQAAPSRLSCGGLKDRHAHTIQYFSLLHGPRRGMRQQEVTVSYLGQTAEPYTSRDIQCNRFRITVRALSSEQTRQAIEQIPQVQREGFANYFDDQRFGSVSSPGEGFIGRLLVEGRFEEALKQALTAPYSHDRTGQKKEKRILRANWGDWERCRALLPKGHARSLAEYLCEQPGDYRGAVARLRPELRGLYLSAFQSYLWNRMLARWLGQHCREDQVREVAMRPESYPMHHGLSPEQLADLGSLQIPLPSARLHLAEDDPLAALVQEILVEEKLELKDLQIKEIREMFFSRGERAALCLPENLVGEETDDESNRGKKKLVLRFDLPRGCYATLLVKRLVMSGPEGSP